MQILSEKGGKGEHFQTPTLRITVTLKPDEGTTRWYGIDQYPPST